jgi:hypothetical protein
VCVHCWLPVVAAAVPTTVAVAVAVALLMSQHYP